MTVRAFPSPMPQFRLPIAAVCIRRNLTIRTVDRHFTNIKSVRNTFKLELTK
jgi:predicted nucleic acid-binding protein